MAETMKPRMARIQKDKASGELLGWEIDEIVAIECPQEICSGYAHLQVWVRKGCNDIWNERGRICAEPPGGGYNESPDEGVSAAHGLPYRGQRCRSDLGKYDASLRLHLQRVVVYEELRHCWYGAGRVRSRDLEGTHRVCRTVTLPIDKAIYDTVLAQGGRQLGFQTRLRASVGRESLKQNRHRVGRDGHDGFTRLRVVGPLRVSLDPLLKGTAFKAGLGGAGQEHSYRYCQKDGSGKNQRRSCGHALSVRVAPSTLNAQLGTRPQ